MIQYSDEWWAERIGKVTASKVVDICKGLKGKYLASRKITWQIRLLKY